MSSFLSRCHASKVFCVWPSVIILIISHVFSRPLHINYSILIYHLYRTLPLFPEGDGWSLLIWFSSKIPLMIINASTLRVWTYPEICIYIFNNGALSSTVGFQPCPYKSRTHPPFKRHIAPAPLDRTHLTTKSHHFMSASFHHPSFHHRLIPVSNHPCPGVRFSHTG